MNRKKKKKLLMKYSEGNNFQKRFLKVLLIALAEHLCFANPHSLVNVICNTLQFACVCFLFNFRIFYLGT